MSATPKHPHVKIKEPARKSGSRLVSYAASAMRKQGVPMEDLQEFGQDLVIGSYDETLERVREWVTVEP